MRRKNREIALGLAAILAGAVGCSDDGASATQDNESRAMCRIPEGGPHNAGDPSGLEIAPAPPSIGADVPVTYFGPAPSSVNPKLVGPVQLLKSGTVDLDAARITLPLYKGRMRDSGKSVWYILTDTDDAENAAALGLNFSGKLAYVATPGTRAARTGSKDVDGHIVFDQGAVDFSPVLTIVPGAAPMPFPPQTATPGSLGDDDYSPLVTLENAGGHTYNAPVLAFDVDDDTLAGFCDAAPDKRRVHDKVVKICRGAGSSDNFTVTMDLTQGFSFGRPVFYLSTEASNPIAAALENATLAPGLAAVGVGRDDSAFSAIERIFVVINGPQNLSPGEINPQRQGLFSALSDGRGPLNVLGGIPTIATDYSPIWDFNLVEWTASAISKGYRSRVNEEFQILGLASRGFVTGAGGSPFGSTGIVVNCPIVQRLL